MLGFNSFLKEGMEVVHNVTDAFNKDNDFPAMVVPISTATFDIKNDKVYYDMYIKPLKQGKYDQAKLLKMLTKGYKKVKTNQNAASYKLKEMYIAKDESHAIVPTVVGVKIIYILKDKKEWKLLK